MASSVSHPSRVFLAAVALALLVGGCRPRPAREAPALATPPPDVSRLHVLLLNGGGQPAQNYQSHLLHVQQLDGMLRRIGVPRDRVAIFSSDGDDPGLDLAMRDEQPEEDFWLLEGTRLEGPLKTPVVFETSTVPDATMMPASKAELGRWFETVGRSLPAGDTLFIYVTDHGTKNATDLTNNGITMWGVGESLSVQELGAMLAKLDPGVRVVTVMSQCFSGGFAYLGAARVANGGTPGTTCGYYSSTPDRPAYGCYPENRGRENVGHSFHFLEALAETGSVSAAHRAVLVHDATPDVPLRSSDVFLDGLLIKAAKSAGQEFTPFVDAQLRRAWQDQGAWEAEVRLLDRIGQAFGSFSPRSLAEVDEQAKRLAGSSTQLKTHHDVWDAALSSARRANIERYVSSEPTWAPRLSESAMKDLNQPQARKLTADLLGGLGPATRRDRATASRLTLLRDKSARTKEIAYRMEVRLGVLLRMRAILIAIAGRTWLASSGTPTERGEYDALRACEDLAIPAAGVLPGAELARAEPFPPIEDDLDAAGRVLPAWMGIQFKQAEEATRTANGLAPGAAAVVAVYPESPALAAGLQVGDVVTGPPGTPFRERDQIREWTMLRNVDEPATLDVLRDNQHLQVTLVPKPMPGRWPKLSAPPKTGAPAPALELGSYRGAAPTTLASGKPHLLFFWATWCTFCKAALPELDAFERERGTPVVAITDEQADRLDPFFAKHKGPFPSIVATDAKRSAFLSYGVSGMPTFVLVDANGVVQAYATGYNAKKGLAIDGWEWSKRPTSPPG